LKLYNKKRGIGAFNDREGTYSDDIGIAGGKKVAAGEELTNLVNDHS